MAKERPILFSTPMVQAILSNKKLQTRRIVKPQPEALSSKLPIPVEQFVKDLVTKQKKGLLNISTKGATNGMAIPNCPYGEVGDLLWVRETTKVGAWDHDENTVAFDYKASPELIKTPWVQFDDDEKFIELTDKLIKKLDKLGIEPNVDEENECFTYKWDPGQSPFKWTPGIHMPKAAARIWLEITDIKIERLKDISEKDARNEGVETVADGYKNYMTKPKLISSLPCFDTAYFSFLSLWESINGYESSELNPWVWVITFKKVEKP